jgi:hypothetical protein
MPPVLQTTAAILAGFYIVMRMFESKRPYGRNSPANTPYLHPWVPFVGSIGYALKPQQWMVEMHKQMGDVFTTTILGQTVTFVSGHKNVVKWAGAANKELDVRFLSLLSTYVLSNDRLTLLTESLLAILSALRSLRSVLARLCEALRIRSRLKPLIARATTGMMHLRPADSMHFRMIYLPSPSNLLKGSWGTRHPGQSRLISHLSL